MSEPTTCPTCGGTIAADAPGGACPKCMFQAGFATGGSSKDAGVPSIEELAPKFPGLVIEEVLGRGGMGVVFKARHKALDREVALKVLPASAANDPQFADRFQREARALARLQHPNIVAVHDFGRTDDVFWLVMEFVDGTNIRQAMRAGEVGPKEALAIVPQICDALQYAHEHGVVHRDIKPENVMIDKTGRVKVADFGLAKLMEHGPADASLTAAGQVMGTPHYMAPEQWEKPTAVDHRADIYSLGVVFYEMLTGELPLGRFEPPSAKVRVDVRLDEVVLRSLEKAPERRYQHASEVKTDVGRVAARGGTAGAFGTRDAGAARPRASRPRAHAALAAFLVCTSVMLWMVGISVFDGMSVVQRQFWCDWIGVACAPTAAAAVWCAVERRRLADAQNRARTSMCAVFGAFAGPIAALGYWLFWCGAPVDPWRVGRAGLVASLVLCAGFWISVAAWWNIARSGGRLRGLPWAITGTFLPIFVWCPLGLALTFTGPPEKESPVVVEIPHPAPESTSPGKIAPSQSPPKWTEPSREQQINEFAKVREFWKDVRNDLYSARDFDARIVRYAPSERARLKAMPTAEREQAAAELQLGLPLVPTDRLPEEFGTEDILSFSSSPEVHATLGKLNRIRVEVGRGERKLRFWILTGIAGDERSVYFDVAPVEIH